MKDPAIGQARLVIVEATGMVGGYALRYALDHPSVGVVTVIGRRKLCISRLKLNEVLHKDFADCSALAEPLSGQDAAVFCLGVYTGAVPDAENYTIEFARVVRASSPGADFSFLSGMGADQTDAVACLWHAIKERPKKRCWRRGSPAFTYSDLRTSIPWSRGRNRTSVTGFSMRFTRCFGTHFPNQVIPADDLARAMVGVAIRGQRDRESRVFENREIRAMAAHLNRGRDPS